VFKLPRIDQLMIVGIHAAISLTATDCLEFEKNDPASKTNTEYRGKISILL
jgi:hypothetical protein